MLTAFFYVLIPMPYMFFGAGAGDSFISSSEMEVGCALCNSFSETLRAVRSDSRAVHESALACVACTTAAPRGLPHA